MNFQPQCVAVSPPLLSSSTSSLYTGPLCPISRVITTVGAIWQLRQRRGLEEQRQRRSHAKNGLLSKTGDGMKRGQVLAKEGLACSEGRPIGLAFEKKLSLISLLSGAPFSYRPRLEKSTAEGMCHRQRERAFKYARRQASRSRQMYRPPLCFCQMPGSSCYSSLFRIYYGVACA